MNATQEYGIGAELSEVMSLAMSSASNLKQMLDVTKRLVQKAIAGQVDTGQAMQAVLAVVGAVQEWMDDDWFVRSNSLRGRGLAARDRLCTVISRLQREGRSASAGGVRGAGLGLAGSTSAPTSRQAIINSASASYDAETRRAKVVCGRAVWIDQVLRDKNMPLLTEEERRPYRVDSAERPWG